MRAKTEEEREAEEETCVVVCVAAVSHSDARTDGAREYAKATQTLLCCARCGGTTTTTERATNGVEVEEGGC